MILVISFMFYALIFPNPTINQICKNKKPNFGILKFFKSKTISLRNSEIRFLLYTLQYYQTFIPLITILNTLLVN